MRIRISCQQVFNCQPGAQMDWIYEETKSQKSHDTPTLNKGVR